MNTGILDTLKRYLGRKKKAAELETDFGRNKEYLEILCDSLEEAILVIDKNYKITYANLAALRFSNCSKEELIGRNCYEITHQQDAPCRPPTVCTLKEVMERGERVRLEHIHYDGEGDAHNIELTGLPIKDSKGNLIKVIEIARDVTEREKLYKEIKESEKKYRALVESSTDGIAIHQDGKIVYVNTAGWKMLGYGSDKEVIGRHISDFVHPDHREIIKTRIKTMLETRKPTPFPEEKFLRKDGSIVDVEVSAVPITYKGKPAVQVIFRDIIERKRVEEELKESENKFRGLAEKSLVGVYLIQDGVFKYVNPRLARIFGYTVEELIEKKGPKDLVFPKDWPIVEENLRKRISGEIKSIHYDFRGITKNKEIIYVEVYGSRTVYRGRPAVIGTLLDITERKKMEEQLKKRLEELERMHKAFVGRELRMAELKREIKELKKRLGEEG